MRLGGDNATRGVFDGGYRNRGALAQHDLHFGPNMTPMVDVVMVILIFFMAATAFVGPEWLVRAGLAIDEPVVAADDAEEADELDLAKLLPNPPIELVLRFDGEQTRASGLGIEGVRLEVLAAAIAQEAPLLTAGGRDTTPAVLLSADDAVPYQDVVRVHDACVAAGLTRVSLR